MVGGQLHAKQFTFIEAHIRMFEMKIKACAKNNRYWWHTSVDFSADSSVAPPQFFLLVNKFSNSGNAV